MHFSRDYHVTEDDWDDPDGYRDRERQANVNSDASSSLTNLAEGDRSFSSEFHPVITRLWPGQF